MNLSTPLLLSAIALIGIAGAGTGFYLGTYSVEKTGVAPAGESPSAAPGTRPPIGAAPQREGEQSRASSDEASTGDDLRRRLRRAVENDDAKKVLLALRDHPGISASEFARLDKILDGLSKPRAREFSREQLINAWAKEDPAGAVAHVLATAEGDSFRQFLTRAFLTWAADDPEAALAAYREISLPEDRDIQYFKHTSLLRSIFTAWQRRDLGESFAAWRTLNFEERRLSIESLTEAARDDGRREELLGLIATISNPDDLLHAQKLAVNAWAADGSFTEVAAWIDDQELIADGKANLDRRLAQSHAYHDPQAAADWLLARATPETRAGHIQAIVETWAHERPNACAEWLNGLGLGKDTDLAVDVLTHVIAKDDPESAVAWTEQITDPAQREKARADALRTWQRFDPEAARAYLQGSK